MVHTYVSYPKYDIDIINFGRFIYLDFVFICNNLLYQICMSTDEKKIVRCVRLLSDLKNEDSALYSELLRAINSFNCGEPRYDVPKKISKKILSSVGIKYQGYFTMRFYGRKFCYGVRDLDLLLLQLKNQQMPTIICDF